MADCLIVGCGFVGTALAVRLRKAGHDVAAVTRTGTDLDGIRDLRADVTRPPLDLPEADVCFYLVSASGRSAEAYRTAFVDGLDHVLQATDAEVVYASSTGVYGDADGGWVDETTPVDPGTPRGEVLVEAEQLAQAADGVVVRFAGLYGPGRSFVDRYLDGAEVKAGHVNLIHRDDAASALDHAAFSGEHGLYVAVDDEPVRKHELARWLAERSDRSPGRLVDEIRRPDKRCRNDRLRSEGWTPRYPTFREGLATLL